MFSAEELADLQADFAAIALDTTATIERNADRGVPVHGIVGDNWTAVYSSIAAGRKTPSQGYQQNLASQLGLLQAWVVSLPANDSNGDPVVVEVGDRCIIAGLTLIIQAPLEQSLSTLTQFLAGIARTA